MDVSFNLSLSNLSLPVSPTSPPLDLHHPLPTIIIIMCLFVLFGGFVTFLAVGCPSGGFWGVDGDCGPADGFLCGQTMSSEPELKLWKRLGSIRQSFSSTPAFRRPIQPYVAQSRKKSGSKSPAESKTNDSHTYITIPALLQFSTEI